MATVSGTPRRTILRTAERPVSKILDLLFGPIGKDGLDFEECILWMANGTAQSVDDAEK
jgi:hypothetical protein